MQKEKKIWRKTLVKNIVGVVCLMCAAAIVCRRQQKYFTVMLYGLAYLTTLLHFNFEKIFTWPPYYTLISIIYYILSHVSPK